MMDLSDAVARLTVKAMAAHLLLTAFGKKNEKHAPVEIGGSVLCYTSNPGNTPRVNLGGGTDSIYEHDASLRRWKSLRKRVANGSRIK